MKRILLQIAMPFLLLGLPLFLGWQNPQLDQYPHGMAQALFTILPLLPFLMYGICILMGFRYNNGGLIFSALLLGLTYFSLFPPNSFTSPHSLYQGLFLVLPFNLILFSYQFKRRFFTSTSLILLGLLGLETLCILLTFARPLYADLWLWHTVNGALPQLGQILDQTQQSTLALARTYPFKLPTLLYGLATATILIRLARNFDPRLTGYLGLLVGLYLNIYISKRPDLIMLNFTMIGVILIITTVEASFSMAYYDELTGLPGRRSLNEAMSNLSGTYAMGMMDIDHFKKFNDTYGHKVGDDVLRMVASKLAKTTGRAKVFRYGGEEFTAVFSGKTAEEALPHLEKLRKTIAASMFKVRSKSRKKSSAQDRGNKKQHHKEVSVTISIGVVSNSKQFNSPEKVIKQADKILYKAKKAGRNCVKVESSC